MIDDDDDDDDVDDDDDDDDDDDNSDIYIHDCNGYDIDVAQIRVKIDQPVAGSWKVPM